MIYHGLTLKQKKFAYEYIISGNKCEAAILAGYSENYAKAQSHKLLENVEIKNYIRERLSELENEKIADQKEIMKLITEHARRESIEYSVTKDGYIIKTPTSVTNAIKAAELLGKRYGMWTDKVDTTGNIEIRFEDDYGEDDN